MTFIGTWEATADADRKLVFRSNGTGQVVVQGESFPFFRWWLDEADRLQWQMFRDPAQSSMLSTAHDAGCEVTEEGTYLNFSHAPIPFGFRQFKRAAEA